MRRCVTPPLAVCHECDLLQRLPPLSPGHAAHCARCGSVLLRLPRWGMDGELALTLTALILFLLANTFPFMALEIENNREATTLAGAAWALYQHDMPWLSAVVFFTSVAGPALVILSTLHVLIALRWRLDLPMVRTALHALGHLRPWGMIDVFMLGVLVAFVKLRDMAEVVLGPGLYAFAALLLVSAVTASYLEPKQLWNQLGYRQ